MASCCGSVSPPGKQKLAVFLCFCYTMAHMKLSRKSKDPLMGHKEEMCMHVYVNSH